MLVALENASAARVCPRRGWCGTLGGVAAVDVLLRSLLETIEYVTDGLWSVLRASPTPLDRRATRVLTATSIALLLE